MDPTLEVLERLTAVEHDILALDRRVVDALASRDTAIAVAVSTLESRLTHMNEFRAALTEQAATYITRPEYDTSTTQIDDLRLAMRSIASEYVPKIDMNTQSARLSALERALADLHTRYATVALLFSTGVVIANLVIVWWSHIGVLPH